MNSGRFSRQNDAVANDFTVAREVRTALFSKKQINRCPPHSFSLLPRLPKLALVFIYLFSAEVIFLILFGSFFIFWYLQQSGSNILRRIFWYLQQSGSNILGRIGSPRMLAISGRIDPEINSPRLLAIPGRLDPEISGNRNEHSRTTTADPSPRRILGKNSNIAQGSSPLLSSSDQKRSSFTRNPSNTRTFESTLKGMANLKFDHERVH